MTDTRKSTLRGSQGSRLYACYSISNGDRGTGFMTAHRHALLAGEFDEPCDHGVRLMECADPDCCDLYDRIVSSYLERASDR